MFSFNIDEKTQLKLLEERHAEEIFTATDKNRTYLRQWLPWLDLTKSPTDTKAFIASQLKVFAESGAFVAGIWFDGKYAGTISYHKMDKLNKRVSLGYWLAEEFQGHGLITKACRVFVDHAFSELKLNKVEIQCATENTKSRAIPERLGFKQEGTIRQAEWIYDHFVDHAVYGMLASEWKS